MIDKPKVHHDFHYPKKCIAYDTTMKYFIIPLPIALMTFGVAAFAQTRFDNRSNVAAERPAFGGQRNRQQDRQQAANGLSAEAVEVKYINKVDVPARTEGVLLEIAVEEGDTVDEDQMLAKVDDRAAKLTVQLKKAEEAKARHEAKDDVNLRDARNNLKLATTEAKAFKSLAADGAAPFFDMKRKELEAIKQGLRIELAEVEETTKKIDVIIKRTELDMAEEQLQRGEITAPTPGYIEERLAQKGQWVQPGTPICTLIRMDKLRVEGKVDGLSYPGQITKGHPVEIRIDTSGRDQTVLSGSLGYVSMEMDVNGQHRVWAEVDNRMEGDDWLIKPGMTAELIVPVR